MSEKQIQVRCIKDVVMTDNGEVAYIKGKTYDAVQDGIVIQAEDEQGYPQHYIRDEGLAKNGWFDTHFVTVFEEKEKLPKYVEELLKQERKELEEIVRSRREKVKYRKENLREAEESLSKAENQLAEVLYVLEG
jgi:hypothetical protein